MTEEKMLEEARRIAKRALSEDRWYPRRHMRLALFVILPIFLAFIVIAIVIFGD